MAKEYKEGIYFGMPFEEYLDIPTASRTFLEKMLFDEEEGWLYSPYNPNKPEHKPTPAMELGTAIHSMLLEPEIFSKYVQYPCYADYPGTKILKTTEDLKNFLVSVGEKKTGVKADLIDRATSYINPNDPTMIIWDCVIEKFKKNVEESGKRILNQDSMTVLDGINESLSHRPKIKEQLQAGYSEVTIIWEDYQGITYKARLDRVDIDSIIDLKSFSVKYTKKPLQDWLDMEIKNQNYNLQSSIYFDGLKTVIRKIKNKEAEVFGEVNPEWLSKFLENEKKNYSIIFTRTQSPYQIIEKSIIKASQDLSKNLCFTQGMQLFMNAVVKVIRCKEEFQEKRWIDHEVKAPKDDVFMYQVQP